MDLSSFRPIQVPRWGSLVELESLDEVPLGVAAVARNVRYGRANVTTRDGLRVTLKTRGQDQPISGLAGSTFLNNGVETDQLLLFDRGGRVERENPIGSGQTDSIVSNIFTPPVGCDMQATAAYNKLFLAFTDLLTGKGRPAIYDFATGKLDPCSGRRMGEPWEAAAGYVVGEIVTPAVANGHWYRCIVAGTSGAAQPAFPVGVGAQVVDGTVTWQESTPSFANDAVAGNICAGQRYFCVLFKTRTGHIYGMHENAILGFNASGSKRGIFSGLPIGPENIVARIVISTIAGAVQAGPFFYIDAPDLSGGVTITSMVIEDNVTTVATLNFDDEYLQQTRSATERFRNLRVPACSDVYYDESLNVMVYTGCAGNESGHWVSLGGDPETVDNLKGKVVVAEQNGERAVAWHSFRGTNYSLKERSGHLVQANPSDPATWVVVERWSGCGPAGARAVDSGNQFMLFAGRAGVYLYDGSSFPIRISTPDIDRTWARINWAVGYKIWVMLDEETLEARIGLPLDDATDCSHIFTMSFREGYDAPIQRSERRRLQLVMTARKWSLDDIAAICCERVQRTLTPAPNQILDGRIVNSQILLGSASPDGAVNMIVPDVHNDNGNGIESIYETGNFEQGGAEMQLGGIEVQAAGAGPLKISLIAARGSRNIEVKRPIQLDVNGQTFARGLLGSAPRYRVRFSNNKDKDAWFELQRCTLRANPLMTTKREKVAQPEGGDAAPTGN